MVQKKELKQWFIRTTAFAQQLYDNLDSQELAEWPTAIKEAQRQWIKPGHGHFIKFPIITGGGGGGGGERDSLYISVFTTRMDTLPKVTFLALSLDHALAPKNASSGDQVQACTVQNPLTGETLNVYVADYVLSSYGSDAVMGVPTEDERDGSFAALHGIPLLPRKLSDYEDIDELEKKGLVKAATCFKMRDWLVSRQRYWASLFLLHPCLSDILALGSTDTHDSLQVLWRAACPRIRFTRDSSHRGCGNPKKGRISTKTP